MFTDNLILFVDGEYKKLGEISLSPFTHTLHYGSGVFDGIRANETVDGRTAVFRLYDHVDRFLSSTKKMGLQIDMDREEVAEAIREVVRKNNFTSAYIRPLAFFDDSSLGLVTTNNKSKIVIGTWQWGKYLAEGIRVGVSEFRRISEKSTFVESKFSGHYVNSLLANTKAKQNGFDDALMLDTEGFVAEGSVANVFFIKGKNIVTPQRGKIFPGITRDSVIQIAKDMGFEVEERNILEEEMGGFEEAFFTGTAAQVAPIAEITLTNGKKISFGIEKGKLIGEEFKKVITGANKKFAAWLEFI